MTTGHAGQLDEIGVEILGRAECLRLLGSVPIIGRISFTSGWNVTVVGTSDVVADPASIGALNDLRLPSWAPDVLEHYVTISMTIVSGRRIVNANTREMAVD